MFQSLKKLMLSKNETIRDRALKLYIKQINLMEIEQDEDGSTVTVNCPGFLRFSLSISQDDKSEDIWDSLSNSVFNVLGLNWEDKDLGYDEITFYI